jgi:hypothetical protein
MKMSRYFSGILRRMALLRLTGLYSFYMFYGSYTGSFKTRSLDRHNKADHNDVQNVLIRIHICYKKNMQQKSSALHCLVLNILKKIECIPTPQMITVFLGGQTLTIIHFLARNLWGPRYTRKKTFLYKKNEIKRREFLGEVSII